jgi:hypothetical protein
MIFCRNHRTDLLCDLICRSDDIDRFFLKNGQASRHPRHVDKIFLQPGHVPHLALDDLARMRSTLNRRVG